MKRFLVTSSLVVVAAVVEIAVAGKSVYHSGWFNVALGALVVLACASRPRGRVASWPVLLGCVIAGIAALAYGLFAPDDRTVRGAPGQRIAVEGLGTVVFPLADPGAPLPPVTLVRGRAPTSLVGARAFEAGNAIVREIPHTVVAVEAWDVRGNHLTITQPQGGVFLSPVLMMEHQQSIGGLRLPFDSFNVPAARRVVKAVLFSPAEAAVMLHAADARGGAVLFAVDDENDRPLPHGIALAYDGQTVRASGLELRATLQSYPGIAVTAAPNIFAVCVGGLLLAGGLIAMALGAQ